MCETPYRNVLCLFRCLSLLCGFCLSDLEANTQTKFCLYCQNNKSIPRPFQGFLFTILSLLSTSSKLMLWFMSEQNVKMKQFVGLYKIHPKTMQLNLFKNHFSYTFNFEKYSNVYHNPKCDVLWYRQNNHNHHIKHCQGDIKYIYKGSIFRLIPTIFDELAELDIHVPENDQFYPYFSVFNFECILLKENLLPTSLSFSMNLLTFLSAALLL